MKTYKSPPDISDICTLYNVHSENRTDNCYDMWGGGANVTGTTIIHNESGISSRTEKSVVQMLVVLWLSSFILGKWTFSDEWRYCAGNLLRRDPWDLLPGGK